MADRVGGATCPPIDLAEVLAVDTTTLKRKIARARLVVVHSLEIDKAGEVGAGLSVFDKTLQDLRAAWRLLREAGVSRFVITADHGFLLLDDPSLGAVSHGRKIDPNRRHVISGVAADEHGKVRVPLSELGYEGCTDQLVLPQTVAVFDKGKRAGGFVHGGNSLQERVIPVLTVSHHRPIGSNSSRYRVNAERRDPLGPMQCLKGTLELDSQTALSFGAAKSLELCLRVLDAPQVRVKLQHVRGGATLDGSIIQASVGESFELFFELSCPIEGRVRVELHHPSAVAEVAPCAVGRFAVSALVGAAEQAQAPSPTPAANDRAWLNDLPEGGVRDLFEHLAVHGSVTELEANRMLEGGRAVRRFSNKFEDYAAKAPFEVRIDTVANVKRYVREGATR